MDAELRALADETPGELQPAKVDWFWEPRRENELTPDYLGRVLDEIGLSGMARDARAARYDDFFEPAESADGLGLLRLVRDLRREAKREPERIAAVENAVRRGEFDATRAESDRWAASKEGQATMRMLTADRNDLCPCGSGRKFKRCHVTAGRNDPCPCGSGRKFKRCHGA